MAPKKSKSKSSPSPPHLASILNLIRDYNSLNIVTIRHIKDEKERKWKSNDFSPELLVLGKSHIKKLCFPIHPLILQFPAADKVDLMQLTPNSIKCLVAVVILNEVKGKWVTLSDFLYALRINKTPTPVNARIRSFQTFYLIANAPTSKKYFMLIG